MTLLPADQVEIPDFCFDTQGSVACFMCDGARWPTLLVPATREASSVLAAWKQHTASMPEHLHADRPVLATLTSPIHAWQWPDV